MKKCFITAALAAMLAFPADVAAQGWLRNLGEKAADKAIEKLENKGKKDKKDKKAAQEEEESEQQAEPAAKSEPAKRQTESAYAKSDFVPGDVVFFADDLEGEQLGEFPSQWDLANGNAEVAKHDGRMCITLENNDARIMPLIKGNINGYLPDQFTFEFDYWCNDEDDYNACYHVLFNYGDGFDEALYVVTEDCLRWAVLKPNDEGLYGDGSISAIEHKNDWNHFAMSFNKRALKVYINGTRVANLPNVKAPTAIQLGGEGWDDHRYFMTGFRLAQGAVPLYERVMSEGKIVTYAITFDVAKATIKPESMTEIMRIKKLMDDNPTLNFEVQGHCDSTGSAATNDKLSQQRAEAIVLKLVELGIDRSRLAAVGKGSREPIADNGTDEGRARNRRVEFVKK